MEKCDLLKKERRVKKKKEEEKGVERGDEQESLVLSHSTFLLWNRELNLA